MAKNLTKQIKRSETSDSHGKRRAYEIAHEETDNLNIDGEDINTEIVELMAGEILRKVEFFDMLKETARGSKELVHDSQNSRLMSKKLAEKNKFV